MLRTIFLVLLLAGCASQIMKGYIGKPVQAVVVDYGPPSASFDMSDGRKAFQWSRTSSYTLPTTAYTTNTAYSSYTTVAGGQQITEHCVYTLFARWNADREAWIVTGFNDPSLDCE